LQHWCCILVHKFNINVATFGQIGPVWHVKKHGLWLHQKCIDSKSKSFFLEFLRLFCNPSLSSAKEISSNVQHGNWELLTTRSSSSFGSWEQIPCWCIQLWIHDCTFSWSHRCSAEKQPPFFPVLCLGIPRSNQSMSSSAIIAEMNRFVIITPTSFRPITICITCTFGRGRAGQIQFMFL
jgi:hypothetical protein